MSERRNTNHSGGASPPGWGQQSGKATIRGLIGLLLIVGLVYSGYKFIPVRAAAYQFADAVRDEVVFAGGRRGTRRTTDETIRKNLLEQAQMLSLPVSAGDIRITRPGAKYISIDVTYTVPVELIGGYVFNWTFSPHSEGPLIF
jgi:hypothetical protein